LLTVSDEERRDALENALYVKQLLLLEISESDDLLLDSIDDAVKQKKEFTRFAQEGGITSAEISAFEDRVREKWKTVFKRQTKDYSVRGETNAIKVGLDILDECREHRESLGGHMTEEYYLTRGTFHALADRTSKEGVPFLGWHPEFKELLKKV
jgi:hypothetical protein